MNRMQGNRHGQFCCRNMQSEFRQRGLRMTVPRQIITNILGEAKEFLSAEDIYEQIQQDFPGIGLATVYRTLNLLSELGVVTRYEFGEGKARYELAEESGETHHHQIICEKCFKVIRYSDFSSEECEMYSTMEKTLSKKYGINIRRHVVQYYGICRDCS
ncbi:MAG: transcriptional repressor [Spirochaetales bacterium]|nr:transcriptional repressor [Spirochaetales bacterium]